MEAKTWQDTVIHAAGCTTNLGIIEATCNCGAEYQAKITWDIAFKVGKQEGFADGQADKGHNDAILRAVEASRQEGIKEVVEWVNKHGMIGPRDPVWQDQLKEWIK